MFKSICWIAVAATALVFSSASTHQRTAAQWNNLGVAYMEQQRLEDAQKAFEKAHALDPRLTPPQLNLAIALLNAQKADDARRIFNNIRESEKGNPRFWYNLGLLERSAGNKAEALAAFERASSLDPNDAYSQYFIGDLHNQSQQYAEAEKAFRRSLELSKFNVSAEFGLARAYQRLGRSEGAKVHFANFQQLTQSKIGVPISPIYGEQGPLSLAQRIDMNMPGAPSIPVKFVAESASGLPHTGAVVTLSEADGGGVCVFDMDADGRPDILLTNTPQGKGWALFRNDGGRFTRIEKPGSAEWNKPALSCAVGDYDNDGKPDFALSGPDGVTLFHNEGGWRFRDVTKESKLSVAPGTMGITFVDYDHDGDLDLLAAVPNQNAQVWRNNGDGTFTDVSRETKIAAHQGVKGFVAMDFNNDRAIDVFATGQKSTLSMNPREGAFQGEELLKEETVGAATLDLDKDGWMDIAVTLPAEPGIALYRNVGGKSLERVALPETHWKRGWGIAVLDYDNDGWLDIAAIGEGANGTEVRLFRNTGSKGFVDVSASIGLDKIELHNARALVAFDSEGKGAADLLVTELDGSALLLKNVGGSRNHSVHLQLQGLADNRSALGTKVEVFAGDAHQKFEIAGSSGYLSQAPAEVLAGIGGEEQADVVRILWPTGVLQDELEIAASQSHKLLEIDRRGSSCPVLFAWNGERYQLVTDVIGPAVIGHWVAPGETDVPDPDEWVKVDGNRVKLRDGKLSFRFAEPMEEANYLDQVRLLAVDHPAEESVFPNERFVSAPPFPDFKVIASRNARVPAGAWDDHGHDVLQLLSERDHRYVTGFRVLKFAGFAEPHSLELDLGKWDKRWPLRLLMHGFTEYFTANSMYAANQAGIRVTAPYIEAKTAAGWKKVVPDMGFPAGLPRTMIADLTGAIPEGTRRIRIVTNLQIYWDQILISNEPESEDARVSEVPLANANLHFHGYPKSEERYIPGDLDYRYEEVSATGPYARHEGAYTRYGDVLPLLRRVDDQFVVFGSGEEVMLDFDPGRLPKLPAGLARDYFFYANGFVKDMDFYESDALTVWPLPFHAMSGYPMRSGEKYPTTPESVAYQLEWNDRYQTGAGVTSYRFRWH